MEKKQLLEAHALAIATEKTKILTLQKTIADLKLEAKQRDADKNEEIEEISKLEGQLRDMGRQIAAAGELKDEVVQKAKDQ